MFYLGYKTYSIGSHKHCFDITSRRYQSEKVDCLYKDRITVKIDSENHDIL